jgi:CheY-like chemotaxis protein/DNA-binding transcriptional ArsR family regulator
MTGTILVIDDQREVRENIVELLEISGHRVIEAVDGIDGIRKAKAQLPDLVLCDIMMPELDGYGVAEVLGSQAETASIPLVFLTAKSDAEDFRKGLAKGAVDYITKPFESHVLIETVEMRLKKRKQKQATNVGQLAWENWAESLRGEKPASLVGKSLKPEVAAKNEEVYMEGDYAQYLYFVREGSVRIDRMDSRGKRICLRVVRAGGFFGWAPGLNDGNHVNDATSREHTVLLRIPQSEFLKVFAEQPAMGLEVVRQQIEESRTMGRLALNMAYGSARENTAYALLKFAEKPSPDQTLEGLAPTAAYQKVHLSREDLACAVGMAPESISRTLAKFRDEGMIETHGREVVLLHPDRLEDELR